jgi:hypothetical protein
MCGRGSQFRSTAGAAAAEGRARARVGGVHAGRAGGGRRCGCQARAACGKLRRASDECTARAQNGGEGRPRGARRDAHRARQQRARGQREERGRLHGRCTRRRARGGALRERSATFVARPRVGGCADVSRVRPPTRGAARHKGGFARRLRQNQRARSRAAACGAAGACRGGAPRAAARAAARFRRPSRARAVRPQHANAETHAARTRAPRTCTAAPRGRRRRSGASGIEARAGRAAASSGET